MKSVIHDSLQGIPFYRTSEKPSKKSSHDSNTSNPNLPSHFINMDFCIIFKSVHCSTVSTVTGIYNGRFGGSNLGRSKRIISSPKLPDLLQHPPTLQLNFSGSKWPGQTV
jgi:hypothetical protein